MTFRKTPGWLVLLALLVPSISVHAEEDGAPDAIVVEVRNLDSSKGQVGCSIFSTADGFPMDSEDATQTFFVPIKSKKASCTFKGLKPGTYAVSVFHDVDKDGELETSLVGRPKEPWGVSNDAPAERFGPPKFAAAKFKYAGGQKALTITLQE